MDKVLIRELKIDTVIGVYDWEQNIKQTLVIDLDIAWDNKRAALNDDYTKALCYETVTKRLVALITAQKIALVETVAEIIANCILDEFNVMWVKVKVMKPDALKNLACVGVEIERNKL